MCKVSIRGLVEESGPLFLHKAEQLPKIENIPTAHLDLIKEQSTAVGIKLPQLTHLPTPKWAQMKIKETEEIEQIKSKIAKSTGAVKRRGTPFVGLSWQEKPSKLNNNKSIEVDTNDSVSVMSAKKPQPIRPTLNVSHSYPAVQRINGGSSNFFNRVPVPPTSAPKNRPGTPFLFNRHRYNDRGLCMGRRLFKGHELTSCGGRDNSDSTRLPYTGRTALVDIIFDEQEEEEVEEVKGWLNEENVENFHNTKRLVNKQKIEEHRVP